jgi:hypothetical protein
MSDSRRDLIDKINAQRVTIRDHIVKFKKFKKNGEYTSSAEKTIDNCQATIRSLKSKDRSIDDSWEDNCPYDGN